MKWIIDLSKFSLKFINKNNISKKKIISIIIIAIKKLQGHNINIDIKNSQVTGKAFIESGKVKSEYFSVFLLKIYLSI